MMGMDMMTLARMLQGGGRSAQQGVRKLGNVFNPQAGLGEGAPFDPNGMFAQMWADGPKGLRRRSAPQPVELGEGAPVDPNGMFAQQGGGGPKDLRRQSAPQPVEPEKVPWMQQKALGGFERGDLLLAGMGMLGGKNFKEGLGNASGVAYDAFGRQREEGEKRKQSEALVKAMVAKGVPVEEATAMAEFGPQVAFNDMYNTQANTYRDARDEKLDDRYEAQWLRDEGRYESEQERLDRLEKYGIARDKVTDGQWQSEFGLRKTEAESNGGAGSYGLTPVYGRDKDGNRVILQTNKAGGVIQSSIPEGVTLEDDYSKTFARETAKGDAKKAAYETTAGLAVTAFSDKAATMVLQIDDAIEKTNKGNTGLIGQFIAAGDLDGVLDSIGAKAMLSELVAIKAQGGTLGALSEGEGKALRDAAVNVARSQSEEQLDANLRAYRAQLEKTTLAMQKSFEDEYADGNYRSEPEPAAPENPTIGSTIDGLLNKYLPK